MTKQEMIDSGKRLKELKITVNGFEFREISCAEFTVFGKKDKIPFMYSHIRITGDPSTLNDKNVYLIRIYDALKINGKYYAPVFDAHGKLVKST